MINSISFNKMSFKGNTKVQPKTETNSKKAVSKPQEEKKYNADFLELLSVKSEILRIEELIKNATQNNPEADVTLLYQQLGKMINHQIELEKLIETRISEYFKNSGC